MVRSSFNPPLGPMIHLMEIHKIVWHFPERLRSILQTCNSFAICCHLWTLTLSNGSANYQCTEFETEKLSTPFIWQSCFLLFGNILIIDLIFRETGSSNFRNLRDWQEFMELLGFISSSRFCNNLILVSWTFPEFSKSCLRLPNGLVRFPNCTKVEVGQPDY